MSTNFSLFFEIAYELKKSIQNIYLHLCLDDFWIELESYRENFDLFSIDVSIKILDQP